MQGTGTAADAAKLLASSVEGVVNSAGASVEQLEALISFANKLGQAAGSRLKELKHAVKECECGERAVAYCNECGGALCYECNLECVECGEPVCDSCHLNCDFDDGFGIGNCGCGEPICAGCTKSPACGRNAAGCSKCLDNYNCPDCDQCAGYP